MKIALAFSLLLNLWFQFSDEIVWKYAEHKCPGTSTTVGFDFGQFTIGNFPIFHIPQDINVHCGALNE